MATPKNTIPVSVRTFEAWGVGAGVGGDTIGWGLANRERDRMYRTTIFPRVWYLYKVVSISVIDSSKGNICWLQHARQEAVPQL